MSVTFTLAAKNILLRELKTGDAGSEIYLHLIDGGGSKVILRNFILSSDVTSVLGEFFLRYSINTLPVHGLRDEGNPILKRGTLLSNHQQ